MKTPRLLDGRLKVHHLVLVDVLTEQGSVVGAAAALHVTQPVVTRRLRDVEEILGVALYDRGPRGITPTEFGIAFTDHARAVLAQLRSATRHLEEIADARRGLVTVGTHLAGSNLLLPRAIAQLKRERPLLCVIVREGTPDALLSDLSAGRVDFIVGRISRPGSESVRQLPLYEENINLVVGRQHRLARESQLALRDLLGYPWILPGVETVLRQELERYFARQGQDLPIDRVETTSFLIVRQLLAETEMVAALPGLIVEEDDRLAALPILLEPMGHTVGLTLASDRQLNPAAQAMIACLTGVAGRLRAPSSRRQDEAGDSGVDGK